MAGVIGAVSNKFVLAAATLLLTARVGTHRVDAVIDPAAPVSAVSPALAASLKIGGAGAESTAPISLRRPLEIGIGGEELDVSSLAVTSAFQARQQLRIGQDILSRHTFDIDFRRKTIQLLLGSAYRQATRHMIAIPLAPRREGKWGISARINASPATEAILDLTDPDAITLSRRLATGAIGDPAGAPAVIDLGGVTLRSTDIQIASVDNEAAPITIGLRAFRGQRLLLDLPHQKIWLAEHSTD